MPEFIVFLFAQKNDVRYPMAFLIIRFYAAAYKFLFRKGSSSSECSPSKPIEIYVHVCTVV
jgi:hypothetical protein